MNERYTAVVMERDENDKLIGKNHPLLFIWRDVITIFYNLLLFSNHFLLTGGELSWWFCLHQLKASSRKNVLNMIHECQRIISKKTSQPEVSNPQDQTIQKIGDR